MSYIASFDQGTSSDLGNHAKLQKNAPLVRRVGRQQFRELSIGLANH
jgi:hypothetical protein